MTEDRRDEAVELLQSFGLTEYHARAFVALTRLGEGTAKEVSEVAGIPQARVYDCMEALADRGLVTVRRSSPRSFRSVGVEEALDRLRRTYDERIERLASALDGLERPAVEEAGPAVWSIEGRDQVADRLRALVAIADEEVLLAVPDESLLAEDLLPALSAAAGGARVTVGSPAPAVRRAVAEAVPSATVAETWAWWEDLPAGPGEVSVVLMVDGRATLAAVVEATPDGHTHRAVWSDDPDAALASVLRPVLADAVTGRSGGGRDRPADT